MTPLGWTVGVRVRSSLPKTVSSSTSPAPTRYSGAVRRRQGRRRRGGGEAAPGGAWPRERAGSASCSSSHRSAEESDTHLYDEAVGRDVVARQVRAAAVAPVVRAQVAEVPDRAARGPGSSPGSCLRGARRWSRPRSCSRSPGSRPRVDRKRPGDAEGDQGLSAGGDVEGVLLEGREVGGATADDGDARGRRQLAGDREAARDTRISSGPGGGGGGP